jgi:hypothetical protein
MAPARRVALMYGTQQTPAHRVTAAHSPEKQKQKRPIETGTPDQVTRGGRLCAKPVTATPSHCHSLQANQCKSVHTHHQCMQSHSPEKQKQQRPIETGTPDQVTSGGWSCAKPVTATPFHCQTLAAQYCRSVNKHDQCNPKPSNRPIHLRSRSRRGL